MNNPIVPLMAQFKGADIRFFDQHGNPWYVAKDVATALGYKNTSQAIRQHCKRAENCPLEISGQVRHVKIISQGDANRLIFGSKKPFAIEFQDWTFDVVLPALENTGTYSIDPKPLSLAQEARMLATYQNQITKLIDKLKKERNREARQTIYDMLTQTCKKIDITPPALNCLGSDYQTLLGSEIKHVDSFGFPDFYDDFDEENFYRDEYGNINRRDDRD